jgi:hypothetical protein
MRLYKNALILLVIVAVLLGAYILIDRSRDSENGETETLQEGIRITENVTDDIVKITINDHKEEGSELLLEKTGDEWKLTSHEELKTDPAGLAAIAAKLAIVEAKELIEENATLDKLGDYGLDKPFEIAFQLKDGSQKALQIGNKTPSQTGYYARMKDEGKIYIMSSYNAEDIMVGIDDLLDKTFFVMEKDDINYLSMEVKGETLFTANKSWVDWELSYPFKAYGNKDLLDHIVKAMDSAASFNELIEAKTTNLDAYGLSNPDYKFTFGTDSQRYTLLLGDEQRKGFYYYAMLEGEDDVVTIKANWFDFLDTPLRDFIAKELFAPEIRYVTGLDVTIGGESLSLDLDIFIDDEGKLRKSQDVFMIGDKDVTELKDESGNQIARELFNAAAKVKYDKIDDTANPSGEPEIIIEYQLTEDPGSMKVEFVLYNGMYYIYRNGEYTHLTVEKDDPDSGINDLYEKMQELKAQL